jgi:hypothetical protein
MFVLGSRGLCKSWFKLYIKAHIPCVILVFPHSFAVLWRWSTCMQIIVILLQRMLLVGLQPCLLPNYVYPPPRLSAHEPSKFINLFLSQHDLSCSRLLVIPSPSSHHLHRVVSLPIILHQILGINDRRADSIPMVWPTGMTAVQVLHSWIRCGLSMHCQSLELSTCWIYEATTFV